MDLGNIIVKEEVDLGCQTLTFGTSEGLQLPPVKQEANVRQDILHEELKHMFVKEEADTKYNCMALANDNLTYGMDQKKDPLALDDEVLVSTSTKVEEITGENLPREINSEVDISIIKENKSEEYILGVEPPEEWDNIMLQNSSQNARLAQDNTDCGSTGLKKTVISGDCTNSYFKKSICSPTGEMFLRSDTCDMLCAYDKSFISHKSTQMSEKLFKCNICEKSFRLKHNLPKHMCIHTGEKPFNCDACGKSFTKSSHLKTHKHIHTGEKPFNCDVCGKSFTLNSNLKRHKHTHTGEKPFKCDACGKSFTKSSHLKTHKHTHTGEKPFSCDVCGKLFTQNSNMKRHKLSHTGEKPFNCNVCSKSFTQNSSLRTHKRTHWRETFQF